MNHRRRTVQPKKRGHGIPDNDCAEDGVCRIAGGIGVPVGKNIGTWLIKIDGSVYLGLAVAINCINPQSPLILIKPEGFDRNLGKTLEEKVWLGRVLNRNRPINAGRLVTGSINRIVMNLVRPRSPDVHNTLGNGGAVALHFPRRVDGIGPVGSRVDVFLECLVKDLCITIQVKNRRMVVHVRHGDHDRFLETGVALVVNANPDVIFFAFLVVKGSGGMESVLLDVKGGVV